MDVKLILAELAKIDRQRKLVASAWISESARAKLDAELDVQVAELEAKLGISRVEPVAKAAK